MQGTRSAEGGATPSWDCASQVDESSSLITVGLLTITRSLVVVKRSRGQAVRHCQLFVEFLPQIVGAVWAR
jgi:hypothetical protein